MTLTKIRWDMDDAAACGAYLPDAVTINLQYTDPVDIEQYLHDVYGVAVLAYTVEL